MQAVDIQLLHHYCPNGSHRLFPIFHSNKPPLYPQTHSCHPGVSLTLVKKIIKKKNSIAQLMHPTQKTLNLILPLQREFLFHVLPTTSVLFGWAASKKHSVTPNILIQWYAKGDNLTFHMRKTFCRLYWNYITFLIFLMLQLKDLTKKSAYRLHIII